MRAISYLLREERDAHTAYTSPFCAATTYINQDVHIGVEVCVGRVRVMGLLYECVLCC